MYHVKLRKNNRIKRKLRIKPKVKGTSNRPRVTVYKSNKYLYLQAIDDSKGVTIAAAYGPKNVNSALEIGKELAAKLAEKKIKMATFDRNGYLYHGRVKTLADGLREGGIQV